MPEAPEGVKLKVVHHNPKRDRLVKMIASLAVVCAVVFAYWYGGYQQASQSKTELQQAHRLQQKMEQLERENEQLSQQVAILDRSQKIDREAVNNVRKTVGHLQNEKEQLNKEISFYRNIMAPESVEPGLRILDLEVIRLSKPNTYGLRIIVSQVARLNPALKARLSISFVGLKEGKEDLLSLGTVSKLEADKDIALNFRYFQAIPDQRGHIVFSLPEGFQPEKIRVSIRVDKGLVKSIDKTYEWAKEIAADVQKG